MYKEQVGGYWKFYLDLTEYDEVIIPEDYEQTIKYVLDKFISEKDASIISIRYGFADGKLHQLREAGDAHGISPAAARERILKAILRLHKSDPWQIIEHGLSWYNSYEEHFKKVVDVLQTISREEVLPEIINMFKEMPIYKLNLSVRGYNACVNGFGRSKGFNTMMKVMLLSEDELSRLPAVGIKIKTEILNKRQEFLSSIYNITVEELCSYYNERGY